MFQNLDSPPDTSDSFLWADYAELRALVHSDKVFSRGDLDGTKKRAADLGKSFDTEKYWKSISTFITIRAASFGTAYPFALDKEEHTIIMDFSSSADQRLYLALLIASCMRNLKPGRRNEIARSFEESSLAIFAKLMPEGSEVRATWAGSHSYSGSLFNKLRAIAKDIRCTPNFKNRDFKKNDNGDGGIDLIAWHPMADDREGLPIAFAQCGCSREDWRFKQLEASFNKHGRHLPVMHPWATYYFLPLDLRESDLDWAHKSDLGQAIIVDRLRLIRLCNEFTAGAKMPKMAFVEEAYAEKCS